jgi:hypothetical protein
MKIYRILGDGWAAVCIVAIFGLIWLHELDGWVDWNLSPPNLCIFFLYLILLVAGAVASTVLHRGFIWSRILLCIIALLSVLFCGLNIALHFGKDPVQLQAVFILVGVYSLISVFIFLIPKRYVA